MRRSGLSEGIREMKFINVQKRFRGGDLIQAEAAEMVGITDRTFRRWLERFGDEGAALCGWTVRDIPRPARIGRYDPAGLALEERSKQAA